MPRALLARGLAFASLAGVAFSPAPGSAVPRSTLALHKPSAARLVADARHHRKLRRRDDAGDAEVERLNEGQLDRNYRGPTTYRPRVAPPLYPPPPGYGPPPGYAPTGYPPPLGYVPPPGGAVVPGRPPPLPGNLPPGIQAPGY